MSALMQGGDIAEAYLALIELAVAAGARNARDLPGCFEHRIDDAWWMAANAGTAPRLASNGMEVPGLSVYVERQGWPAGIIHMQGGTMIAGTEDELIAACRAAEKALKGGAA
jgi:hypothetical protein